MSRVTFPLFCNLVLIPLSSSAFLSLTIVILRTLYLYLFALTSNLAHKCIFGSSPSSHLSPLDIHSSAHRSEPAILPSMITYTSSSYHSPSHGTPSLYESPSRQLMPMCESFIDTVSSSIGIGKDNQLGRLLSDLSNSNTTTGGAGSGGTHFLPNSYNIQSSTAQRAAKKRSQAEQFESEDNNESLDQDPSSMMMDDEISSNSPARRLFRNVPKRSTSGTAMAHAQQGASATIANNVALPSPIGMSQQPLIHAAGSALPPTVFNMDTGF